MKVLFDTDVMLDILLDRQPFAEPAARLLSMAEAGTLQAALCATSVTTLHYLAGRILGAKQSRRLIRRLLSIAEVAAIDRPVLESALDSRFSDFEDAVVASSATQIAADVIVTRNVRDYKHATLPIYRPDELLMALPTEIDG